MRKPDLKIVQGTGISVSQTQKLTATLSRLGLNDELRDETEEEKLARVFRDCVEGNVITVPTIFSRPDDSARYSAPRRLPH